MILVVISLYHSFPFLEWWLPSIYTLYMNEWNNEWKNYHLSIWRVDINNKIRILKNKNTIKTKKTLNLKIKKIKY